MEGYNRWTGLGNLGNNPELKYTQTGTAVLSFSVACGERHPDESGVWQERTQWFRCVVFGKRAEGLSTVLEKGTRVFVEGSLQNRSWEDSQGTKRYTVEVRVSRVVLNGSSRSQSYAGPRDVPPPTDDDFA
jgi:single-strand DNA-binding protein